MNEERIYINLLLKFKNKINNKIILFFTILNANTTFSSIHRIANLSIEGNLLTEE